MRKRWGLIEFHEACDEAYEAISSRRFKDIQENEKKFQILRSLKLLSSLSNSHIRFFPNKESKTIKRLRRYIPATIWQQSIVRKILLEYWKGLDSSHTKTCLKDSLLRFIYGLQDSFSEISEFFLHKCVFSNDLYRIHKLCVGESPENLYVDIDQTDNLGNTPLMLAVKLKKYEEALVLIDHGADPKFRKNTNDVTPIEQALGMQDKSMLRILITGYLRKIREKWVGHIDEFVEALERMKDFSMTMRWECKSNIIPFVKKFTPSDVYQIYKRGKNLRIDLTLVGWENLKTRRGNISLLFQGKEKKLEIYDHVARTCRDFDTEPSEAMIENTVEKLLKNKKFSSEIQVTEVEIVQDTNWRGQAQVENIGNWECKKKKLTCKIEIDQENKPIVIDKSLQKIKHFEEYLEYGALSQAFKGRVSLPSHTVVSPKMKKHYSKNLKAKLWTCDYFPLSLNDFLPVLDLLSSFSKNAQHLSSFFRQSCLSETGFPIKALIPVYASVKLLVHLDSITINPPDRAYFSFPKHEEIRSDDSTGKLEDWTSDLFYQCDVSLSDDDNLLEAQQLFLSLKSFEATPLITDISIIDEEIKENQFFDDDMPEVSVIEYHHKLPSPKSYNRNSLPSIIFKKVELFKKVKNYAMGREKITRNDADVVL